MGTPNIINGYKVKKLDKREYTFTYQLQP